MDIEKELGNLKNIETDYEKVLASVYYTHFWLSDKYTRILSEYGITNQQSTILGTVLHYHPQPLTLMQLKSVMLEKNSDVSRIVSRLITKGYLKKNADPDNKRKIQISITSKGISLMEKIREQKPFKKFTSELSTTEGKQILALLAKLRRQ